MWAQGNRRVAVLRRGKPRQQKAMLPDSPWLTKSIYCCLTLRGTLRNLYDAGEADEPIGTGNANAHVGALSENV